MLLKEMKSYCHLKPGQNGTKRLVEEYGETLLCVRYRYDAVRRIRVKTVELIVDERPWQQPFRFRDDDLVPITVRFDETTLREKLRKLRAKWDPETKVWLVRYGMIKRTELEARIPPEFLDGRKNTKSLI
jgi:hypothetical protein